VGETKGLVEYRGESGDYTHDRHHTRRRARGGWMVLKPEPFSRWKAFAAKPLIVLFGPRQTADHAGAVRLSLARS
jgi:hypothetical protein